MDEQDFSAIRHFILQTGLTYREVREALADRMVLKDKMARGERKAEAEAAESKQLNLIDWEKE